MWQVQLPLKIEKEYKTCITRYVWSLIRLGFQMAKVIVDYWEKVLFQKLSYGQPLGV